MPRDTFSSKHAPAYSSPAGPGDARPTAMQVVEEEGLAGQLVGKTVLVTGCSSGLGVETARALYQTGVLHDSSKHHEVLTPTRRQRLYHAGARVVLTVRDLTN